MSKSNIGTEPLNNSHYDKTNNSSDLHKILKHQHKVWNQPLYDYYDKLKNTVKRDSDALQNKE